MRRFILFWALIVLLVPSVASAIESTTDKNVREVIMALTEVAVGVPVSVTIDNPGHTAGYLVVKTENETAAASLVVAAFLSSPLGDEAICSTAAITANVTTTSLFGSLAAANGQVSTACDFPMPRSIKFVFTVTGAGADFDVTAEMQWLVRPGY